MRSSAICLGVLALLGSTGFAKDFTIKDLVLEQEVIGKKPSLESLKGKVTLVEKWGIN